MKYWFFSIFSFSFLCVFPAFSADVYRLKTRDGGATNAIVIEGRIEKGDYDKYATILREKRNSRVLVLYSQGGDLQEALKIGRLVRQLFVHTQTALKDPYGKIRGYAKREENNLCASSCFYIWVAGVSRGGNVLGLHRPYVAEGQGIPNISEMGALYRELRTLSIDYLKEMDFDQNYAEIMFSTPSTDVHWVNPQELAVEGGYIPGVYEYLYAICENSMPRKELAEFNGLERLGSRDRYKPLNQQLNPNQLERWRELNKKHRKLKDCMREVWALEHRTRLRDW